MRSYMADTFDQKDIKSICHFLFFIRLKRHAFHLKLSINIQTPLSRIETNYVTATKKKNNNSLVHVIYFFIKKLTLNLS